MHNHHTPIRDGRYIDATTDLNELVASTKSSDLRWVLKRLLGETKRDSTQYQIINIQWENPYTHNDGFELTVQLTRDTGNQMTDFAFVLDDHYPFRAPLRMTVDGAAISHEKYAALAEEILPPRTPPPPGCGAQSTATPGAIGCGARGTATQGAIRWSTSIPIAIDATPSGIGCAIGGGIAPQPTPSGIGATPSGIGATPSGIGLCDEVRLELERTCSRCLYCQLYGEGTWSPAKFLGAQVDEYLAMRAEFMDAFRLGVGRAKLMAHRVELPEVIIDEILEWV